MTELLDLREGGRAVHPPSAIVGVSALLVTLVALLLLGWGLGEVSRSVARAPDQNLVDELTSKRTRLTPIAHALSWAGSSFVIALWTVFLVVLYQRRRIDALTVALSSAGAAVIFDIDKLLVGRPRPSVRHLELSKRAGGKQESERRRRSVPPWNARSSLVAARPARA